MNSSKSIDAGDQTFLFPGRATDTEASILATGVGDAATAFLGLSARSDTGQDADYIRWHLFDHVPEQARIPGVRNFQRWVSTADCRAARRAQAAPFDRVDHAVQYLFGEPALPTLQAFMDLGAALSAAGRQPLSVPRVQSAAYAVVDRRVNPRGTLGAYALPWWPANGIFLTIEKTPSDKEAWAAHGQALGSLVEVDGVAGAWRYAGVQRQLASARSDPGELVTVFFLYGDPVATAGPLGDLLEQQWKVSGSRASFAAPFQVVSPTAWDRYLP
jgi:hypothetical protein